MAHPTRHEADVIIVGAGLSGMIAARKLLEAGLKPLVLEADERVGGRILTQEVMRAFRSNSARSGSATRTNECCAWPQSSESKPSHSTTTVTRPMS